MDNQKRCNHCGIINTSDSKFCRQCGGQFLDDAALEGIPDRLQNEIAALIAAKKAELNELARGINDQIELESRKRIEDWLRKGSIGIFLIIGLSAGFGLYSFKDSMDAMQKTKDQIATQMRDIQEKFSAINVDLGEMKIKIDGMRENFEISQAEFEKKKNEVLKVTDDAKAAANNARLILAKIQALKAATSSQADSINKRVTGFLENAQHVENATFDVFINRDTELRPDQQRFMNALAALEKIGFRISGGNVASISVDRSEVLYYSELNKKKADEIVNALKIFYPALTARYKEIRGRGMRELLIKLRDNEPF